MTPQATVEQVRPGLKERLSPFPALLDARYSPMLCTALPQAYTVYRRFYPGNDKKANNSQPEVRRVGLQINLCAG